jgi:hypothetical protein
MDEATYYTKLFRDCRKNWSRSFPARKQCYDNAKVKLDGELAKWKCATCKMNFAYSETNCDHIIPIQNTVPKNHDEFVICSQRLHVGVEGLQILCQLDHKMKTKYDNFLRKKIELIISINSFCHANNSWCPDILVSDDNDMHYLRKLHVAMVKYRKESDEKKIVKLQQSIIKIIESAR